MRILRSLPSLLLPLVLGALVSTGCATRTVSESGTSTGLPYRSERPTSEPARPGQGGYERTLGDGRTYVVTPTDWRTGASTWVGAPYLLGGSDRDGVDCSGFAKGLYQEVVGIEIPRTTSSLWQAGRSVDVASLRPGDLVFFSTSGSNDRVNHVGVMVGAGEFAHASTSRGVRFDDMTKGYWQKRFAGARRVMP